MSHGTATVSIKFQTDSHSFLDANPFCLGTEGTPESIKMRKRFLPSCPFIFVFLALLTSQEIKFCTWKGSIWYITDDLHQHLFARIPSITFTTVVNCNEIVSCAMNLVKSAGINLLDWKVYVLGMWWLFLDSFKSMFRKWN